MIINQDIRAEKQAYYLGSQIICALKKEASSEINLLDIFQKVNEKQNVSYHAFAIALNWLYLLGAVDLKERTVIKCI